MGSVVVVAVVAAPPRPAMAPCKSANVNVPPMEALEALVVVVVVVLTVVAVAGAPPPNVDDDCCCGMPKCSKIFDRASTCGDSGAAS
jgi:hypothetical protein